MFSEKGWNVAGLNNSGELGLVKGHNAYVSYVYNILILGSRRDRHEKVKERRSV